MRPFIGSVSLQGHEVSAFFTAMNSHETLRAICVSVVYFVVNKEDRTSPQRPQGIHKEHMEYHKGYEEEYKLLRPSFGSVNLQGYGVGAFFTTMKNHETLRDPSVSFVSFVVKKET